MTFFNSVLWLSSSEGTASLDASVIAETRACCGDREMRQRCAFVSGDFVSLAIKADLSLLKDGLHDGDRIVQLLDLESGAKFGSDCAPQWLKRVEEILHSRFYQHIQLSEIATEVGVHTVHLCRAFRKRFHCTIGDYIRALRIEHACRQLSVSHVPLATVALQCGFADQSHFSRIFKRSTGMTPLQYRAIFQDVS